MASTSERPKRGSPLAKVTEAAAASPGGGAQALQRLKRAGRPAATKGARPSWPAQVFAEHYDADPMMRISIVKTGLPAQAPGEIAAHMGLTKDRMYSMLGLPRATVERKVRDQKLLSPDESARVLGVSRLIGQAQRMVEESGNPEGFDAGAWVARWIESPVPALGGRRPSELMDTAEGQALVASLLSRAQSGAYS